MAAAQAIQKEKKSQTEDVREYIELLQGLTDGERREVKGIMQGMQIMKNLLTAQSA